MSLPRIDPNSVTTGKVITVTLDGKPYDTVIDANGRQRFVEDPDNALRRRLRDHGNPDGDIADLNEMAIRYQNGEFCQRSYAELNMAIGYSVGGFQSLSSFRDMDLDNPLDEARPEYDPDDMVRIDMKVSRAALQVLAAVMDEGPEALDDSAYGPKPAREEARRAIEAIRALAGD